MPRVLVVPVLTVVEQDVGSVSQVVSTDPLCRLVGYVESQTRFVIRQVDNDAPPPLRCGSPPSGPGG